MDKELKQLIEKEIISEVEKKIKETKKDILWIEFLMNKGREELKELEKETIILPNQRIEKVIKEKAMKKNEVKTDIENLEKMKMMKEKTIKLFQEYIEWLKEKTK
jgi:hypothetical protein